MTISEIEAIVAATKEPFRLQKDVAQTFRVSAQLVSVLAREAIKKPEKLEARREREQLHE